MRARSRPDPRLLAVQLGLVAALFAGWQLLSAPEVGILKPLFFSRPTRIAERLQEWFVTGYIYRHIWITLLEALLGFVVGAVLGVGVGFLLARNRALSQIFNPYIKVLNALPRVVLAPIFFLWFGLDIKSKVALAVTLVFFIVFFNTYQGIREVDLNILNNARMLGASERQLTRHVLLPSAVSWILSSLHTSAGFALVGAVIGEYLGSSRGLGYVIQFAEGTFDSTGVFAGMVVLAATVIVMDWALTRLEDRLLVWKPQAEAVAARPG